MAETNAFTWSTIANLKDDLGRVCCPYCGEWFFMERTFYYTNHYLARCLRVGSCASDEDNNDGKEAGDSDYVNRVSDGYDDVIDDLTDASKSSEEVMVEDNISIIHEHAHLEMDDTSTYDDSYNATQDVDIDQEPVMNVSSRTPLSQMQTIPDDGEHVSNTSPTLTGICSADIIDDWNAVDGPKGTVAWFRKRLAEKLHSHSHLTVLDIVLWSLGRKVGSNMSREDFNAWMRMLKAIAPDEALIPPSWHMVKNIAGVQSIYDYMYHTCGNCYRYRYGWIPVTQYEKHRDDKCPHCKSPRFKRSDRGSLEPVSWVFYLGIQKAVDYLFGNPQFVLHRGIGRQYNDPSTWYGSKEAHRQNSLTNGALFAFENSSYSLFVDAFQCYKNKTHSIGVVFLRCDDLDYVTRSKRSLHVPIMVIPGPTQPDASWIYMDLIANDFAKWGPDGEGHLVIPAVQASNGCIQRGAPFRHKVLLSGIDGDTPAAQWVGQFVKSSNSYLSCFYCKFCGQYDATQSKMVYGGFSVPAVAQHGLGKGKAYKLGTRDEQRLLKDTEQRQRADAVTEMMKSNRNQSDIAKEQGAYGWCAFANRLHYVDYNLIRRIPITHSILLGLCKRFWKEVFRWKSGGGLKPISKCIQAIAIPDSKLIQDIDESLKSGLILTPDFNRPFSGLNLGMWTSEDWMRWVEVYSTFLQKDCLPRIVNRQAYLPPIAERMWAHLRAFALHHLQPVHERYCEASRREIRRHILEFGKLATEHAPSLLLPNLHKLACFAHIQEANCGLLGHNNELWGERALLPLKNCARNAKKDPDIVVVNAILAQIARGTLLVRYNRDMDCNNDEVFENVHGASLDANINVDVDVGTVPLSTLAAIPTAVDDVLLKPSESKFSKDYGVQGKGREASAAERRQVCNAVQRLLLNDDDVLDMLGIEKDDVYPGNTDLVITTYSYAYIHETQTITSSIFERSQTRDGSIVQVRFDGRKYAGKVEYYATIKRHSTPECEITIAMCKFYANTVEIGESAHGSMLFCAKVHNDQSGPWTADSGTEGYPVTLDCIDTKLAMLRIPSSREFHQLIFVTYKFQSNLY